MSAAELAHALGNQRVGHGWIAKCPAHQDRTPSLSIGKSDDGKLLFYCHAGCGQAQVIAALQDHGQCPADQQHYKKFRPPPGQPLHDQRHHDAERTTRALSICRSATPACGTFLSAVLAAATPVTANNEQPQAPTRSVNGGVA
jgi:putative DNA primase/helicase